MFTSGTLPNGSASTEIDPSADRRYRPSSADPVPTCTANVNDAPSVDGQKENGDGNAPVSGTMSPSGPGNASPDSIIVVTTRSAANADIGTNVKLAEMASMGN